MMIECKFIKECAKRISVLNLLVYTFSLSFLFWYVYSISEINFRPVKSFVFIMIFGFFFLPVSFAVNAFFQKKANKREDTMLSLLMLLFSFYLGLTIPLITYFNNPSEFQFSALEMIYTNLPILSISVILFPFLLLVPNKKWIWTIVMSLVGGIIIQTTFFNRYMGEIGVSSFNWDKHLVFSIVDIAIWCVVFFLCFVGVFRLELAKETPHILLGAFAMYQIIILLISGISYWKNPLREELGNGYEMVAFDGTEQYVVGSEENVIVFIIDAIDNSIIKELKAEDSDAFDGFTDFTMYTNTNSVFDLTHYSMRLIFTGQTFGMDTNKEDVFFDRIQNAGYKVRFYGYDGFGTRDGIYSYIDNYVTGDADKYMTGGGIKRKELIKQEMSLLMYQVLPCFAKHLSKPESINFERCTIIPYVGRDYYTDNKGFREHIALSISEKDEKCLIMEYMRGMHFPCADFKGTTVYCLESVNEYLKELKRLGCYDSSTIIVMSDHGIHDDDEAQDIVFPTAATPMFMIKEKNAHHDKIEISSAPISYEDIQATLLKNMDLYKEEDGKIFPPSIYDYSEGDSRVRIWYDSNFSNEPSIMYTYEGDTSALEETVRENKGEKVNYYP